MPDEHPLQAIVRGWPEKLRLAEKHKRAEFQDDADECMRFFDGPHDFMYTSDYATKSRGFVASTDNVPMPTFRMTFNKTAEAVQIFGPALYHRNPFRQVNPRKQPDVPMELFGDPNDPMVQQQIMGAVTDARNRQTVDKATSTALQSYLNYTPNELDLKGECTQAIDEAIIKGMGVVWPELWQPAGSPIRMVGSFFDSIDNLLVDPDMESRRNAHWVARRRVQPVWVVERKFGLEPGELKGNSESFGSQALAQASQIGSYYRARGDTQDLITYWEIYSRMGVGARMSGAKKSDNELDRFGDYVYLAICEDKPWPLNLPPRALQTEDFDSLFMRMQWPTPFYADPTDPWPFTAFEFHKRPKKVWPMSHIKPGLGEIKFLNWAYSFVADKIKNTCRDFIVIAKSAGEELKSTILGGRDLELIEIEKSHGTIAEVVQFLQHPNFNGDIWRVIEAVTDNLEKRLGLNELMYGTTATQLRSASEANVKADQISVRPGDMAAKVEDAMTGLARKEAIAARWHLEPQDVAPILGPVFAGLWGQFVMSADPHAIVHELEYRIEAGSIRKPNRDRDIANYTQAVQMWGPVLQWYATVTGDFSKLSALAQGWAKAMDLDPAQFAMQPPPMPPMGLQGPERKPSGNGEAKRSGSRMGASAR